ncbi:hypothetical protein [Chlorogloea sp. CCALA 695]|uniref:hypothetical protein n=1 Tax=Chlorogloea sp. CCALA 695 TaxID=2107693 RepID=UPI001304F339|nr:hypothetical protein [Chlorogloea sp. CCALA 695]
MKLDVPVDMLAVGDCLLNPDHDDRPTALCRKLSRGEVIARKELNNPRILA